jgi:integrase
MAVAEQSAFDKTIGEFLVDEWLPAIRSTIRATTYRGYESHVRVHLVPHLGAVRLTALDARIVNVMYGRLIDTLSPASVRRIHATLHRAMRDARRWGYVTANVVDRTDPPKHRPLEREQTTWTAEELRRFLRSVMGDELEALWVVYATTGLRRGEALGLRWGDVDLDRGELAVRQTIVAVNHEVQVSTPKTKRGRRVVALDDMTVGALRRHRPELARGTDLVFVDGWGEVVHPSWVTKRFGELAAGAGLPRIRLHDLRHTHATLALQAGIHPKIVSERLGHSTVSLTLDVYSHALPHLQREAADALGRLLWDDE